MLILFGSRERAAGALPGQAGARPAFCGAKIAIPGDIAARAQHFNGPCPPCGAAGRTRAPPHSPADPAHAPAGITRTPTKIPVRATESVSRCDLYISRRDFYISRRELQISRRETDFRTPSGISDRVRGHPDTAETKSMPARRSTGGIPTPAKCLRGTYACPASFFHAPADAVRRKGSIFVAAARRPNSSPGGTRTTVEPD